MKLSYLLSARKDMDGVLPEVVTTADKPECAAHRSMKVRHAMSAHMHHALVIAIAGVMAGCSSTPVQTAGGYKVPKRSHAQKTSNDNLDLESADSLEELLQATDMDAVEGDRLAVLRYGNVWSRIRVGFKMDETVDNPRVAAQRNWFISRQPYLDRLSARASRYLYYTVTEAERRGIPTELALLPVIESSYDPFATSNASAAGMWQFIPSTGRIYGLRQDAYYDGRRDVVESTRAAYDFLTSLYQQFGSWELALASYNAGAGRIQQAINRNLAQGLPTDYWSLRLPQETMNYVPRFIAVAQIVKDPNSYGVQLNSIANRPHFRSVSLPGPVDMEEVVRITGLTSKEIFELNPAFMQGMTSPSSPNRLLIPTSLPFTVDNRLKSMQTIDLKRFSNTDSGFLAMSSPSTTQTLTETITRSGGSKTTSLSTSQAAAVMSAGSGTSLAASTIASNVTASASTPVTTRSGSITETVTVRGNPKIPTGADALASMANQASVPTQAQVQQAVANLNINPNVSVRPMVPAPVTTASVAPVTTTTDATTMTITRRPADTVTQPAVSSAPAVTSPVTASSGTNGGSSVASGLAALAAISATSTNTGSDSSANPSTSGLTASVLPATSQDNPVLTVAEKNQVVSEIKAIAPANTPVIDPLDGKIQLTAIQTQQAVLDKEGNTKSLSYAQPYLKAPSSADIKNHKLLPAETRVVADIPEVKPKGTRTIYTVRAGDTLGSVAARAGLNWRDIAKWNQMGPNANLITGTPLYLYGAKKMEVPQTSYVVQAGDTLTDVAAQFNLTPKELAERNNLKPNSNLITGTRLSLVETADTNKATKVDSKDSSAKADSDDNSVDYTVKRGDTLAKVAARYSISIGALAKLNDIPATTSLQTGDTLSVPDIKVVAKKSKSRDDDDNKDDQASDSKPTLSDYTVKSGETLARIAARHGLTVVALADMNNIPANTRIQAGDTISVPEEKHSKKKGR